VGILRADHATPLYPVKLALNFAYKWRSLRWTKGHGVCSFFFLFVVQCVEVKCIKVIQNSLRQGITTHVSCSIMCMPLLCHRLESADCESYCVLREVRANKSVGPSRLYCAFTEKSSCRVRRNREGSLCARAPQQLPTPGGGSTD
jgi:hypothetical protein